MKAQKAGIVIRQLDENRYALTVDDLARYMGAIEECERRAAILSATTDRAAQDRALGRASSLPG